MQTKSLSCRNCGGVLKCAENYAAYRCEYCHSVAVLSETPLLVDGIQPTNDAAGSSCPACSDGLHTAQLDGRPILYCPGCFGMFVRREHFGAIVNERRSRRVGLEHEDFRPIDPLASTRRLRCPGCEGYLEAHPYYGPGNVVIDSCAECSCSFGTAFSRSSQIGSATELQPWDLWRSQFSGFSLIIPKNAKYLKRTE